MLTLQNTHNSPYPRPFQNRIESRVVDFYERRVAVDWGGFHLIDRDPPGENAINLSTNDYLNLSNDPGIAAAISIELAASRESTLMSSLFLAKEGPQRQLERAFAQLLRSETTILCQSGWTANMGLLQAIADRETTVYIDFLAHMSLWQGIQSAGAMAKPFRHNAPEHLSRQLRQHGPGIIIVDSVYSTDGTICPLAEIAQLASEHGCVLVVDESHSLGTHGAQGAGLVCELGLQDKVDFRTASLAKAFAGRGGLITCSDRFREYFLMESYPSIFSSALLPHEIAGFQATLEIIREAGPAREQLRHNAARLREGLQGLGLDTQGSQSQIVSLLTGSELNTGLVRQHLEKLDIHGAPFGPPATPRNRALIRFTVRCDLQDSDIDQVIAASATLLSTRYQPRLRARKPTGASGRIHPSADSLAKLNGSSPLFHPVARASPCQEKSI